jgi:hypothetical protein
VLGLCTVLKHPHPHTTYYTKLYNAQCFKRDSYSPTGVRGFGAVVTTVTSSRADRTLVPAAFGDFAAIAAPFADLGLARLRPLAASACSFPVSRLL